MLTRLGLLALAILAVAVTFGYVPNPLLAMSSSYNAQVATGMAAVYGSLRILKGVLMMAADANFSGGIAVVSIEGSPGQLVTPVIDTVERMANLVFILLVIAGLMAVLIPILGNWAAGLVAVGAVVLFLLLRSRATLPRRIAAAARALVLLGLFGTVLVPGAYTLASFIGDSYVPTGSHTTELNRIVAPLEDTAVVPPPPAPVEPKPDQSLIDQIVQGIGQAGVNVTGAVVGLGVGALDQVGKSVGAVGQAIAQAQQLLQLLIALAVSYILKLVVLPIIVIAGVSLVIRVAWRTPATPPLPAAA